MRRFLILTVVILALLVRLIHLGSLPPSPYWEEVALGYDAYSILKTGKDHHGNWFPVVAFESFGDWKPGLYIYSVVPSIAIFGLSTFAIRLPSVIAGMLIVIGCYYLSKILFHRATSWWLHFFVLLAAAIEPWGIIFSRAAWESNLATALILWSVIGLLKFFRQKPHFDSIRWLVLSVILSALAMYTYHAARLIAPLLFITTVFYGLFEIRFLQQSKKQRRKLLKQGLLSFCVFFVLTLPLTANILSNSVTNRFATTSIFTDISIIEASNEQKELADNTILSRILYHRYVLFGKEILSNYAKHFDPSFLFVSGDVNPRHSIQSFGQLYPFSVLFLILGASFIWKRQKSILILMFLWMCIGILPSAITQGSPHAVRTLSTFPVFAVLVGFGLYAIISFKNHLNRIARFPYISMFVLLLSVQFSFFLTYFSTEYARTYSREWQYGYDQMILSVNALARMNPEYPIYITREQGRPAMYYWFFSKTDPKLVQSYEATAGKDQSEFLEFGRIQFIDKPDQVSTSYGIVAGSPNFLARITNLSLSDTTNAFSLEGDVIWQVGKYEK